MSSSSQHLTNYAAFTRPETGITQIGHLNAEAGTIQPLSLLSGYPIKDLYQVIEAGPSQIVASGSALPLSSVKILAPLVGRDVLAVGKNYMEHAKEFNASGYDSSDKVDKPSHPVIFTKRATSIIADGEDIYLHPEFSKSVDYEGEVGVIVGKVGFRIPKEKAMDYVWGYTIINDMTARERQRDHKQFYIGKSADTFCPMVCLVHVPLRYCLAADYPRAQLQFRRKPFRRCCAFKRMSMASYDKTQRQMISFSIFQP